MGNLHEFVDANIATLQVLMQEKRKLHMIIEEGRLTLSAANLETDNYTRQLGLLGQEREISNMRQTTLLVQTSDLETEVRQTCQKIVDLSDAYAGLIEHVDYQLSETQAEKEDHSTRMRAEADHEAEHLRQQSLRIEALQEQLRLRDLEWGRVRA